MAKDFNQQNKKYDAFISYSHKDKTYVSEIQRSIENLGLPILSRWKSDVKIFRDERKIPLAHDLTEQILYGINNSKYLIVIASKNSANSKWVKEEIVNWHKVNSDNQGFITNFNFILIDDIVEWDYNNRDFDKIKTNALPKFGKKLYNNIPIWANIKDYCESGRIEIKNPNYKWEIAKIKGLLLGKKPDEIINEEYKNKNKFIIFLLFLVIIFSVILSFSIIFWKRAEKRKVEAEISLVKMFDSEIDRHIRNWNIYTEAEEYEFALIEKLQIEEIIEDSIYVKHRNNVDSIRQIINNN